MQEKSLFIDVLKLVPEGSTLFIQAPSSDNSWLNSKMENTEYNYYKSLILTPENLSSFIKEILDNDMQKDIQSIEIRNNGQLLFEGFDGLDFGTISKHINFPAEFSKHLIEKICTISNDW